MAKEKAVDNTAISIRRLSQRTKIPYMKIWNNLHGNYNSLTVDEKTQLMNAVHAEITPFLKKIGFAIKEVIRIKED